MKTQKMKLFTYLILCCAAVFALGLIGGCKGSDGTVGATGATGAPGVATTAQPTAYDKKEACLGCHGNATFANIRTMHPGVNAEHNVVATINNVWTVPSGTYYKFKVDFTVTSDGAAVSEMMDPDVQDSSKVAHLSISLTKLIPGTNGDADQWWSVGKSESTLTSLATSTGTGEYIYTTANIAAGGTGTNTSYDDTRVTRVLVRVMPNISQQRSPVTWEYDMGHTDSLARGANAYQDITGAIAAPAAIAPGTYVKDVVRTANCLECHDKFGGETSFHAGEGRITTTACVICHNQNRGNAELDFFVHSIHSAKIFATSHTYDFSEVTYPQDLRNCTKCHKGGADSDNWKNRPSMKACASCHDTTSFTDPAPAGMMLHKGGAQADNSQCASILCHNEGNITTPQRRISQAHQPVAEPDPNSTYAGGTNANTNAAWLAAAGFVPTDAQEIQYLVSKVTKSYSSGVAHPSITFKLQSRVNGGAWSDMVFSTGTNTKRELFTSDFKGVLKGEASYRLEAPRGELFYYVKGNGTKGLERVKIRTPTLASVSVMRELLLDEEFADIPVTVLSFDPCMSCQDR